MPTITTEELFGNDTSKNTISTEELFADEKTTPLQRLKNRVAQLPKRQDLVDVMAGVSPEELSKSGQWVLSGIQQTGKDVLATPAHWINQLLMNYPRAITHQAGFEYPEKTQSGVANVMAHTAGVIGGIQNPLGKEFTAGETALKTALKAGALGVAYAPEQPFSKESIPQRLITGGVSAVAPFVAKGAENAISGIQPTLKASSARIINSLIKPLLKDFSYGKNPGLAVAQEGLVANNLDELAQKISVARQNKGKQIAEVLNKPQYQKVRLDITEDIAPIDEAMQTAAKQNNQALVNRLQETKKAITQNLTLGEELGQPTIKTLGDRNLSSLTPLEATKIKTEIGDLTKWTGNVSDDKLVNKALKQTYGNIKDKIGSAVPEVKPLNERYANLTSAEIATKYRDNINARQNMVGIVPKIASMGEALAFLATGNPQRLIESIAIIGADKIIGSPALKTRLASGLSKLGEADLSIINKVYPTLIAAVKKVQKF